MEVGVLHLVSLSILKSHRWPVTPEQEKAWDAGCTLFRFIVRVLSTEIMWAHPLPGQQRPAQGPG